MLLVITGPSGVGKTTIIKLLLDADSRLKYSTSLTTRKKRSDEVDGIDYFFVSEADFQKAIADSLSGRKFMENITEDWRKTWMS